jgi:hypothetical protein
MEDLPLHVVRRPFRVGSLLRTAEAAGRVAGERRAI